MLKVAILIAAMASLVGSKAIAQDDITNEMPRVEHGEMVNAPPPPPPPPPERRVSPTIVTPCCIEDHVHQTPLGPGVVVHY